jgi:hypothetical protein
MSEEKLSGTALRNVQKNLDAVERDLQISKRRLEILREMKVVKLDHYSPGEDFEYTMNYQNVDEFWECAKKLDELKMDEELGQLEAHIRDRQEKADEYRDILKHRG